ncbi:MAG: hypothetical protein FJ298_12185 [Planctomycetes bacterium]|nr:hypothetical protein [Planctomycetota bacterium]
MKPYQRLGTSPASTSVAPRSSLPTVARGRLGLPLAACALALSACSGSGGGQSGSGTPEGTLLSNPASGRSFLVESNSGGSTVALRLIESYWGRLVDVYANDSSTERLRDFVIASELASDGVNYRLERDPLTERERLTILRSGASDEFRQLLLAAEANLQVLLKKGLDPAELPPFTAVPRNSVLVLRFNDVLDDGGSPSPTNVAYPGTVTPTNVRVLTGYAPTLPYEARIFPDPNHGDLVGGMFHSSRVVIDFSVSESDAISSGLPANSLGLPEAVNINQPNVVVRIPTRPVTSAQQFDVLRSLGGRALEFTGNGPTDAAKATADVLRSFRSGGKTNITGDSDNGFLGDTTPPMIVGSQIVTVVGAVNPNAADGTFDLVARFQTFACASKPRLGDVFEVPGQRLQVVTAYTGSIATNGTIGPVRVRELCDGCPITLPVANATGQFLTTFRGLQLGDAPEFAACFVRFSPTPTSLPATGISPLTTITVRFTEPIDPTTVLAFDTYTLQYDNNKPSTNALYSNVIGRVIPSSDLREFTFQPVLPLRKQLPGGQADRYLLEVLGGVSDLAGNALSFGLPPTRFSLSTTAAAVDSGSISLKFNSGDEDGDSNPEVRGQILFDIQRRLLKPRSVSRFSAVADASVPVVGAMIPFPQPIQTPLSNYGSKLMGVWRYHDVGFGLRDEANHNVDVEGLWWTPFTGTVQSDNFSQFQMSLAHCKFLPDEELSTGLLPNWVGSGLVTNFDQNRMGNTGATWETSEPLTVMHAKSKGYTVLNADTRLSSTGNVVAPWPINRNVDPSQFIYWTWRDTSKTQRAAPQGDGADTQRLQQVTKAAQVKFYTVNNVPTIGLPMLMEVRTYPDSKASGQNGFKVALAINSSALPYFRMYSTGGVNVNNPTQIKIVQPDSEVAATGGYPQNGLPAPGRDNVFYYGQGDFLVRISRMHTIWFDALATGTLFADPVIEPSPDLQPSGTQVVVAYRAATAITLANPPPPAGVLPYANAGNLDPYGDSYTGAQQTTIGGNTNLVFTPLYLNNPVDTNNRGWKSTVSALTGARFFQARVTFVANPNSSLVPELTSLGFAFRR